MAIGDLNGLCLVILQKRDSVRNRLADAFRMKHEPMRCPNVALLILNFNGLPLLKICLESVSKLRYPKLAIYVIDNASADGSREFVKSNYPRIKLVHFKRNFGFAEAYNKVVRTVRTDYVVLLNYDTVVDSNFIDELVETAESNINVGSVGCKIVQRNSSRRYGPVFFAGGGSFIGPLFFGSAIGRDAIYSIYETATECVANSAAAVLYRKSLIDSIGLFDSGFWSDWEDHDLGLRMCVAGFRNLYTPRTKVLHEGGASFGSFDSRHRVTRTTRNMLFTYFKNYEPRNIVLRFFPLLFGILPYRELVVILENEFSFLLGRDSLRWRKLRGTYLASVASYWQFIVGLRSVMEKRRAVQCLRQASDEDIIRRTSKHLI